MNTSAHGLQTFCARALIFCFLFFIQRAAAQLVTTVAGGGVGGTIAGSSNGNIADALYNIPSGVAVGSSGIVYVADANNNKIRAILPNQTVITLAGGFTPGAVNGMGSSALFSSPRGVAADSSGIVYVADSSNSKIRASTPTRPSSLSREAPPQGSYKAL
jgi:serine/threonine-protein kinase